MKAFTGLIFFVLAAGFLLSCNNTSLQKISYTGTTQGTYYRITFYHPDTAVSQQKIEEVMQAFDASVSVYNPASLITKVNAQNAPVIVDDWFLDSWSIAKDVSEETDGAFDCTIGPLVEAWGFSFRDKVPMNQDIVDSLLLLVDYRKVSVEGNSVRLEIPGMHLDFNAVAQGLSVDVIAELLEARGVTSYLVDIGGEVKAAGTKPGGAHWRVGIEKPVDKAGYGENMQAIVQISDKALATSGSYRKFYLKDGKKYSHTIDPHTGYPVTHSLLSVTVVTENCGYADAWATAMMILGPGKSKEFLKGRNDMDVFLIYADEQGELQTWATEGFKAIME
jgi:thiamine biosynthesis lipoprotein